jgi:hypothetical protein
MTRTAIMHDGTELQFPDDTPDAVIQATVKRQLSGEVHSPSSMPLSEVATQAASNLIPSIGGQVVNVVKAAIHPIDTLTNLHKIVSGAAQNMLPESLQPESRKGDRDAANAIAELYKNNYGSAEGFKHHLASDPGAVMMDASALLTGGAGLAGKVPALAKPAAIAMEAGTKVNPLYVPAILARKTARGAAQVAPVIADAVSPTGQAATLIKRDFPDGNIPTQAPSLLRDMPADFVGAPVPKFGYAGVEPTAAMISDNPNILRMEMNARNRNPVGFFNKDNQNTSAIYSMLQDNAISDIKTNGLQDALNAKTGPLREAAFEAARNNPTFRDKLQEIITNKGNEPGIRASKAMPVIKRATDALILREQGANKSSLPLVPGEAPVFKPWYDKGVDYEKDNLLNAITKEGGINKDLAQQTYGNNIWEDVPGGFNVFRNSGGHSLDDLSARMVEHGYLPEGSGPYDLVDALYGNPREQYSINKNDFGYNAATTEHDQLTSRLDSLINVLGERNTPKAPKIPGNLVSHADPKDIYTLRKELGDSLNSTSIAPDELTNAAKSNLHLTSELMGHIDDALNESSGGAFENYLKQHSSGMGPITQGRAFQNIVDKFDLSARVYGNTTPQITPFALRKAVDDNTFFNAGKKGYTSTIGDTQRTKVTDAVDAMNALEAAKKGTVSVTGSPTATFAASLMKEGLARVPGAGLPTKIISVAKALGELRGQKALDDALLNPEKLQTILDKYHARNKP